MCVCVCCVYFYIGNIHREKSVNGTFEKRSYLSSTPQKTLCTAIHIRWLCVFYCILFHSKCFLPFSLPSNIRPFLFCSVLRNCSVRRFTREKCVNTHTHTHSHMKMSCAVANANANTSSGRARIKVHLTLSMHSK